MAWIPNFFSTSVKILSLPGLSSADSTDFHQDEKMEPRLWHCVLKLNFTRCGSQCTNWGAPRAACSVFSGLANCWTAEKGSRLLRNTWEESEISHPDCPIWDLCPEAPQFRDSLPSVGSWVLQKTQSFSTDPEKNQRPARDDPDPFPHLHHD